MNQGKLLTPVDHMDRKSNSGYRQGQRSHPYARPRNEAYASVTEDRQGNQRDGATLPPEIQSYNFCVSPTELVGVLEGMGRVIRWPRKNERPGRDKDVKQVL